jgi:hypothetical protein
MLMKLPFEGDLADLDRQAVLALGRGGLQRRMLRPYVELHHRIAIDVRAEPGQERAECRLEPREIALRCR